MEKLIWGMDNHEDQFTGMCIFPREVSIRDTIKVVQRVPALIVLNGRVRGRNSVGAAFPHVRFQFGNQFHNGHVGASLSGSRCCFPICADQWSWRAFSRNSMKKAAPQWPDLAGH
jgi:hypothetical protein